MDYNAAGLLAKQTYGNGDYVDFSYDTFDRQTEKRYNGDNSQRVTYSYGNNGSVAQITDYFTNSNTRFTYDLADRVVSQREYSGTAKNGGTLLSYTDFTYADKTNYLTGIKHFSPLGTQTIGYTFGVQKDGEMPDQIYKVTWNGAEKVTYKYDNLGRLESKHTGSFDTDFTYEDVTVNDDQRTTTLVKSVSTPTGTLTYEYDKLGNILSVTDGNYTTSYEYDSLNQLVRVNDEKAGKTTTYSYTNGNITECNEYPVGDGVLDVPLSTKTWEYNDSTWSDLLTNYNGTPITYDEIGNPLTIGEKSLTWTGRQLQSITDGDSEISYTYNGDGLRTSKTVNDVTTEYYYNGSTLAGQKSGYDTLVFKYDNNSDIFGFIYNDTEYYYIKNAQNDVIAIADANGTVLVKYEYDAWGKVISITDKDGNPIDDSVGNGVLDVPSNTAEPTTADETATVDESVSLTTVDPQIAQIAHLNPILYRSYYYDKETEWYYLNTRYYSPDMCRFINADAYVQTAQGMLDKNMFAYCLNNPVNMFDDFGNWPKWMKKAANWVNKTIIKPISNFFNPNTNTISGKFKNGIFRGSGSLTAGYSEKNKRLQINSKSGKKNGMLGIYRKTSIGNASGKIGVGNEVVALSLKGVGDGLTATTQAGIQYKEGIGLAARAKASVLSGRVTAELELSGWQIELGVSGDFLSIGAEAMIGVFPDEGFMTEIDAGAGLFGAGFVFRIKPKQ